MFSDTPVNNMSECRRIHNQESPTRRFLSSPEPLDYVQKKLTKNKIADSTWQNSKILN